jgi:hypothetical protein
MVFTSPMIQSIFYFFRDNEDKSLSYKIGSFRDHFSKPFRRFGPKLFFKLI